MGYGYGPGMMGYGPQGQGGGWGPGAMMGGRGGWGRGAGFGPEAGPCWQQGAQGVTATAIDDAKAKEIANDYVAKNLPGHTVEKLVKFERLGGNRTLTVNVRILAATHRDLEGAIKAGAFREDLYYRLNVVTMQVPPLRERREDIPLLLDHFLRKFAQKNRREVTGLTAAARSES